MSDDDAPIVSGPWDRLDLHERAGGVCVTVHVRPRSSRSKILGVRERALEVALTSPPADGAANAELTKLLARALGVRPTDVSIAVGSSGRVKLVQVNGIGLDDARARLQAAK
jgi:hypothetical protein